MSYHLYQTEGCVLGYKNSGEYNRVVFILTSDLGLVPVLVQSARKMESKHRPHIGYGSIGDFSLVKGREWWRLVGARSHYGSFPRAHLALCARLSALVQRFIHGEEHNRLLYQVVRSGFEYLHSEYSRSGQLTKDHRPDLSAPDFLVEFELLMVQRILAALGYAVDHPSSPEYCHTTTITSDLLSKLSAERRPLTEAVNKALKATDL